MYDKKISVLIHLQFILQIKKRYLRVTFIELCFVACMMPMTTAAKEPCDDVWRCNALGVGLMADGIPAGRNSGDVI